MSGKRGSRAARRRKKNPEEKKKKEGWKSKASDTKKRSPLLLYNHLNPFFVVVFFSFRPAIAFRRVSLECSI